MSDHIYKCISESYQNSFFDFLNLKLGAQKKKQLYYFQDFMKMKVFKILSHWKIHLSDILPRKM